MKLELFREDLKEGNEDTSTSRITFEHLNQKAQAAVLLVGRAVVWDYDKRNYNAVYSPKRK